MRTWRSHPVLFLFAAGAALGFLNAAALMFTVGILRVSMNPLLLKLWPTSIMGMEDLGGPPSFAIFEVLLAVVSNAALYGAVFATTAGLVIAIRGSFGTPDKPISISRM
jgi:hypothetical protein